MEIGTAHVNIEPYISDQLRVGLMEIREHAATAAKAQHDLIAAIDVLTETLTEPPDEQR